MPRRLTSASVNAIVQHATAELRLGAPLEHVLREVTLMGALYGGGISEQQAIRQLEAMEPSLLSMGPWEQAEARQMGFHVGIRTQAPYQAPGTYGYRPGGMY